MDFNELFYNKQSRTPGNKRTYDVRVTLNKSGNGRFSIRFGFLNDAVKAFKGKNYVQVSRVDVSPDVIYFRLFDKKEFIDVHKLCTNSNADTSNLYTAITPPDAEEKIYRAKWVGKTFKIEHDEKHDVYFISQEKETM